MPRLTRVRRLATAYARRRACRFVISTRADYCVRYEPLAYRHARRRYPGRGFASCCQHIFSLFRAVPGRQVTRPTRDVRDRCLATHAVDVCSCRKSRTCWIKVRERIRLPKLERFSPIAEALSTNSLTVCRVRLGGAAGSSQWYCFAPLDMF